MSAGMIGRTLGRYQILELLGAGGMATVYKADDTRLERQVAIKVIRREVFSPDEMEMILKRFEREAKSVAGLSHPNIVGVIDYGEFEGAPYLVMEYLPGGTLKERLGSPIPWRDAIQLILPIARALEYVHTRNIINRDVKPSNVLMTENGEPMLTDFGLVKIFGEKEKDTTTITSSGTGLGTPDYMAPEQWTGEATAQSDLYSLGVVLYEMITGHRPYVADTPAGVLFKQASEPLPLPTSYIPDLPKDIESVLLKALAKDPANRYADMRTLINELESLLAGRKVSASTINTEQLREQMTGRVERQPTPTPSPAYKRGALPVIAIAVIGALALLGAIGGCWLLYTNPGILSLGAPPTQQTLPSPSTIPPSPTAIPPTETIQPTGEPTSTPPAAETPLPDEIEDSKKVPMRLIPAGEFTMGSNETGDAASRPSHTVYVEAFYIDKYEVTNEMYDACAYAVECRRPRSSGSVTRSTYYNNPVFANYPVLYVDWSMAVAYCEWRGARLPTEAEWEKAARGTDERVYPWGTPIIDCSYANLAGCVGDTTPVDQYDKSQSPYGVYGMAGNVWEWTSTLFKFYPYSATDGREDLSTSGKRIARSGSWHTFGGNAGNARADTRFSLDPGYYGAYVGFRCAKSVDQVQESP
ncbi:MAG: SUMF1/EgtB/PvdO family nonheme iron enzyme [Anaerolineales bacterium]|nr:SUMF1/EgtB/PvdO family nonheme iron enzyme [Anaerolineales bacterium]